MNIYTHVAPELQREATERVAEALWPEFRNGVVSNSPPEVVVDPN